MRRNSILFIAAFIMAAVITGIQFGMIFLLSDRFDFSSGVVGLIIAIGYGGYMAGCEFYRQFETRINVRLCLPSAVLLMTIGALAVWFSMIPWLTGISWAVFSFTAAFYWPPLMGWISNGREGKELNRDLGRFNQAWSIGALIGPLYSGFLYSRNPVLAYLFFIISLAFLSLFLTLSVLYFREMREWISIKKNENKVAFKSEKVNIQENGTSLRFPSWVGLFSSYAFLGFVANILPLEIRDSLGYSEQVAGNLLFIRGTAALLSFSVLGKTVRWHYRGGWLLLTQGLIILIPILFLVRKGPLFFYTTALILFGLLFASAYSSSIFHGCTGVRNKGGRMAIHEGVLTAGAAFGSFLGGLVYQHWEILGAVLFLTILTLCGFVLSLLMNDRKSYQRQQKRL